MKITHAILCALTFVGIVELGVFLIVANAILIKWVLEQLL